MLKIRIRETLGLALCLVAVLAVGVAVAQGVGDEPLPARAHLASTVDVQCLHNTLSQHPVRNTIEASLGGGHSLDGLEFETFWATSTGQKIYRLRLPSERSVDEELDLLAYYMHVGDTEDFSGDETLADFVSRVHRKTNAPLCDSAYAFQFLLGVTDLSTGGLTNIWADVLALGEIAGFAITDLPNRAHALQTYVWRPNGSVRLGPRIVADYHPAASSFDNFRLQ